MSFRKPWTQDEDHILVSLVNKYGTQNWVLISQKMGTKTAANPRSGKQCRQRWYNNLDPSISKKTWTLHQQKAMFQAHKKYGNKWSQIASKFKNRSDSDVKNHFYALIRKCLRRISKIFGQKNSTQKIKNIKPSILSKLLENKNENISKQSSEILFKFILDKENTKLNLMQSKTKTILQSIIERINQLSEENHHEKNQRRQEKKKKSIKKTKTSQQFLKNTQNNKISASALKLGEVEGQKYTKERRKNTKKSKKIRKRREPKREKTQSQPLDFQIENNFQDMKKGVEEQFQSLLNRKSSFRLSIMDNLSPGFRLTDEFRDSKNLIQTRKMTGQQNDMQRIMSNNDKMSIYVTPRNPTPGFGENLFSSWNVPVKITKQQIDYQTQKIRKQISRNNQ